MAEPILSLDVFEPRFVAIGPAGHQVEYELAHPGTLSLVALRRREKLMERYEAMLRSITARAKEETLSEEVEEREAAELSQLLFALVRMCLKAPDEVISQLGDQARVAILQAFMEPQREQQAQPAGEVAPATPQSIGASGSPG